MKTLDELLAAFRDETITEQELKDLERLLADKGAREQLFDEFLMTATISEALKTPSPSVGKETPPPSSQKRPWTPYLLIAGSLLLVSAAAYYFQRAPQAVPTPQESAPPPVVQQKRPEQAPATVTTVPLPAALKGFSGTIAGRVTRIELGFILVKLTMTQPEYYDQEVMVVTKEVPGAPILNADDRIYAVVKEKNDCLVASVITKLKPKLPADSSDF